MKPEGTQAKTFIQLRFSPNRSPTKMNTTNYVGIHWQNKKSYESSKYSCWLQQKAFTMSLRKLVDWTAPPSCFRIIPLSLHFGREQILTIRKVQKSIELAVQEQKEEEQWITNSNNRCSKTWQTPFYKGRCYTTLIPLSANPYYGVS